MLEEAEEEEETGMGISAGVLVIILKRPMIGSARTSRRDRTASEHIATRLQVVSSELTAAPSGGLRLVAWKWQEMFIILSRCRGSSVRLGAVDEHTRHERLRRWDILLMENIPQKRLPDSRNNPTFSLEGLSAI